MNAKLGFRQRFWLCALFLSAARLQAQTVLDTLVPVRGFCIAAPATNRLDEFIRFIEEELAPRSVNTLILRVDYNYQYASHPELGDSAGLSRGHAQQIAAACRRHQIRVIPQINLLGHQSWRSTPGKLLKVYPEFDETPAVKFPERYAWPNPDRLYCKSYCPRHPKVHEVVFALVDEICQAFESDAFHAGLDEVFYIGEDQCPRCAGRDKAQLFADEVRLIRDHLKGSNRRLWIWGDRLLDGKTSGLGEWEASINGVHPAVDLIPKDVVICDWHYERPDPTAAYFAVKGLDVVTCPWKNPESAVQQLRDVLKFRESSTPEMKKHFLGVVQTVWSGSGSFLDEYYGRKKPAEAKPGRSESKCFVRMFEEMKELKRD